MSKSKDREGNLSPAMRGAYRVTKGAAGTLIEISLHELPLPPKRFAAHCFRIDARGPSVELQFGQRLGARVVSLVGIQLEPTAFMRFHGTINEGFRASCRKLVASPVYRSLDRAGLVIGDEDLDRVPAERYMALNASLGYIEVSSNGALFDWYEIPARTLLALEQSPGARVQGPEPILEIRCSVPLLGYALEQLDATAEALPRDRDQV